MTRKIKDGHTWVAAATVPVSEQFVLAANTKTLHLTSVRLDVIEAYCARCRVSMTRRTVTTPCVIDGVQQGGPRKGIT